MTSVVASTAQPKALVTGPATPQAALRVQPSVIPAFRRFSVDEYHQLIRDGYFAHDERFELLDGLIIRKMPKDPVHEAALGQARKVLAARLPVGWHIRV